MAFGLTIGTERANALQQCIQDELMKRKYTPDADLVMAEYITIMVINNKTPAQITSELEDLIGSDFDPAFTDWLFAEAAKGASEAEVPSQPPVSKTPPAELPATTRDAPLNVPRDSSKAPHGPRDGLYQQAVSQAVSSNTAQKRTASVRSPSPSHPHKARRTDLPTGPRAMQREGGTNPRSLIDRVGGHAGPNRHQRDEIQARIDNITNSVPDPNVMMAGGFPGMGMGGMDMNAMALANPLMLQEMFMSNMALMQQLSTQIGMIQGFSNGAPNFAMQGNMSGEVGMFAGGPNNFNPANGRGGRGGSRGGRGAGRGRGGSQTAGVPTSPPKPAENAPTSDASSATSTPATQPPSKITPVPSAPTVLTPTPTTAVITPPVQQIPYAVPERPQSPTLCKFGLKCTNVHCRWSHPSPVATPESGVVLSNEACEKGKDCKDQDCIKAHVSPAVLNPPAQALLPAPTPVVHHTPANPTPCRFGLACTRPNCMFTHPRPPAPAQYGQPCRFGAACTRATCPYQHPEGRVLPTSFHRGLSTAAPMINVPTPETGTIGPSPHKSMTFNNPKARLEKQVKELEGKKSEAEKAVKEAEAAVANANSKTDEPKPVATAA